MALKTVENVVRIACFLIVGVLFFQADASGTSDCHQEFMVLGETFGVDENAVIWISENLSGQCLVTHLIRIETIYDSVTVSIDTVIYKDWKAIGEKIGSRFLQDHVDFRKQDSLWLFSNHKYRVIIPRPDSAIINAFKEGSFAARTNITDWNVTYGKKGIMVPEIEGLNTELIYSYPLGLYMDYYVDRICYFGGPKCYYLLVFTNQPTLASGYDTMHGFLLLRGDY